jgi:hypothetical protein
MEEAESPGGAAVAELRAGVAPAASAVLTDNDCERFLCARGGSVHKATAMVAAWHEWRHALLQPLPPAGLIFSPNILMSNPIKLPSHPFIHLLPGKH